eukprot:7277540-Prymnesium_polylepis.1
MLRAMISTFIVPSYRGYSPQTAGAQYRTPNCLCSGDGDLCMVGLFTPRIAPSLATLQAM